MLEKWSETAVFCTFLLQNVRFATAACIFSTCELQKVLPDPQFFNIFTCKCTFRQLIDYIWRVCILFLLTFVLVACNFGAADVRKVVRNCRVLYIFTSKCTFRHSGVPFCNIRTYKSGPDTLCFVYFHFRTCLSPHVRAFFQHQNLQKWSGHVMFCVFSLPNVPFATRACIFSTSELTKVVGTRHVLCIFTSECTFRHRGVHFFDIRTYKSGPSTSCFVHFHFKMCFLPQQRAIFDFSSELRPPHPPL